MECNGKWVCDSCGKTIDCKEDGWLEWLTSKSENGYHPHHPRIVHRVKCLYNEDEVYEIYNAIVSDMDLESFLGPDGLMELLLLISEAKNKDIEDFIRIVKRLHIPNYEESFRYFNSAISEGAFQPNTKPDYYSQHDMKSTIEYIKNIKN